MSEDLPWPWPREGEKSRALLGHLLKGGQVDQFWAAAELNLQTFAARVSELRKKGWPIRSREAPHPKLEDEFYTVYWMDVHFRRWIMEHPETHPFLYQSGDDGRGKFISKARAYQGQSACEGAISHQGKRRITGPASRRSDPA